MPYTDVCIKQEEHILGGIDTKQKVERVNEVVIKNTGGPQKLALAIIYIILFYFMLLYYHI